MMKKATRKMERKIKDMLESYTARELSPWHMPGHKRKKALGGMWDDMFRLDVTEVPGTDDLHHATGAILRSEQAAAEAVGASYAHYLVGGSTAGILAAIAATTKLWRERISGASVPVWAEGKSGGAPGADADGYVELTGSVDSAENVNLSDVSEEHRPVFLVAANCHKSVWNGLRLVGARILTLSPTEDPVYGPVDSGEVLRVLSEEAGDSAGIAGCIITSPTYGGSLSPIGAIHAVLEVYGIPLIVDEAHGAHLPFSEELAWNSGVSAGAEYVIASLHKTLPALTQTAVLYVGTKASAEGDTAKRLEGAIKEQLAVFQSSSPSYLLMLSAEEAIAWADENRERMDAYIERIKAFREELEQLLSNMELVTLPGTQDPTRLLLRGKDGVETCFTGTDMAEWLEQEEGIVVELAGSREIILISTVMDEEADLQRLKEALTRLDEEIRLELEAAKKKAGALQRKKAKETVAKTQPEKKDEELKMRRREEEKLPSVGDFVQRDIYIYPPGVPILRAGEHVTEEALCKLREMQAAGCRIYGL